MRVPAGNTNGVQVHWCDRRKRADAPEINTKKQNVQSEPQLGLFPTLGVDSQAHPEQVHRTDPHEYDRLMGIGSLSSSIGRLPGFRVPLLSQPQFRLSRLSGVRKADQSTQLVALVLMRSKSDEGSASFLPGLSGTGKNSSKSLLPAPL